MTRRWRRPGNSAHEMKAAFLTKTGPPEVVQWGELPKPMRAPGQVLVKVEAAALNPIDTYIRSGAVQLNLPMPFITGTDMAGVVEQCGSGVKRFKAGDRAWCGSQGVQGRQGV